MLSPKEALPAYEEIVKYIEPENTYFPVYNNIKNILDRIKTFLFEKETDEVQVGYFKYTKKKYGVGKRVFKMAPLHHHYQKLGMHESKIVTRFWIVGIMLAVITIVTLKLR